MKKTFVLGLFALLLVSMVAMVSATLHVCNANEGTIWTTNNDCGNVTQDVNLYGVGEKVFINGKDFDCLNYNWTITGQPGGASEDPGIVIAFGSKTVNPDGSFCFEAYTIQSDDGGVYKVDFGKKNDNYHVDRTPLVPEFGLFAGVLTLVSAVGLFFVVRRK